MSINETKKSGEQRGKLEPLVSHVKDCYGRFVPLDNDTIEDGFGSEWGAWCIMCGHKAMQVVRPGKCQCGNCG